MSQNDIFRHAKSHDRLVIIKPLHLGYPTYNESTSFRKIRVSFPLLYFRYFLVPKVNRTGYRVSRGE